MTKNVFRVDLAKGKLINTSSLSLVITLLFAFPAVSAASWTIETIDSDEDVGWTTSIGIDSSDKVHISYYDYLPNSDLKYATNASGSWITETVDSSGFVGYYTSIAVDSADRVHISYYDGSNDALKYATNLTGYWVTEPVDNAGDLGGHTSIAIDSSDKVHISYGTAALKYATNASGDWVIETVDGGYVGDWCSIALDSSDGVHISYYDLTNKDLKYATNITVPDIKANGSDGPLTIPYGTNLTVTIALAPGGYDGEDADWWVVGGTPFGLFWYTLDRGWVRSDTPIRVYGGPLFDLSPFEVLNISGLPVGPYAFYFGVDMLMNGSLDLPEFYYDSVGVTIE